MKWMVPHGWAGVILLIGLALTPAMAVAAERVWEGTVKARSLNVRGGPGEGHEIVGKLRRGDKVVAVDEIGRWVRLQADQPTWVSRRWLSLPDDFMAPAFSDAENKFLDWVADRGDLDQLSVDDPGRLSIVLADRTQNETSAAGVAEEIGCAYRTQTGFDGEVTVTVWPAEGPEDGWIVQSTCP
jgi:hypothetical protein